MPHRYMDSSQSRHVVAIIGGAVAGSEAAAVCAERGAIAIVIEQGDRPFGKIEDGLPRWHDKLRRKEYQQITANLARPGVWFVPRTELGADVSLAELIHDWKLSAVLLASGAWRDRPLFPDSERFLDQGLVYQNRFVHWYNHYPEPGYAGPRYDVPDGAIVVGGGLASIDVVKIINLELYKRALAARGIKTTTEELEHEGIRPLLTRHNLTPEELGVRGVTLFYRREKTAMPLAQAPSGATSAQLEKIGQVRAKVMDKVIDKYLVRFEPNRALREPLIEDGRLVGLTFDRTRTVDGKLQVEEGSPITVRSELVVSSIGSIPEPMPGLPMRGELIDFEDWETGKVRGFDNLYGLGNALTGKGNIKESRKNAAEVSGRVLADYLGVGEAQASFESGHESARRQAEKTIEAATKIAPLLPEAIAQIHERVLKHWKRVGFDGDDVPGWIERSLPLCKED